MNFNARAQAGTHIGFKVLCYLPMNARPASEWLNESPNTCALQRFGISQATADVFRRISHRFV